MTLLLDRPHLYVPADDVTRREFVVGGVALGTLLAAGCSGDDGGSAADGGARLVEDDRGAMVGLDRAPSRVLVVAEDRDLHNALAVGVTPIAYGGPLRPQPWATPQLEGVEEIDTTDGVNFERIAVLEPDLIVSAWYDDATYPTLEQIAPLYVVRWQTDWRQQVTDIGRLLWRDDEADAAVARVEASFESGRERLGERTAEQLAVIHYDVASGTVSVSTRLDGVGIALDGLGFPSLPEPSEAGALFNTYSVEEVERIVGDRLVVFEFNDEDGQATREFLASPLGGAIPAAAGGVVHLSQAATNASYTLTALSLPFLVDELVTALA